MGPLAYSGYPPNCPLPGAVPAEGVVFRITQSDPPTDECFKSLQELGFTPKCKPSKTWLCKARSLSVYRDVADAFQHLKMFAAHGEFIAVGTLTPEKGETLPTPADQRPSHEEWWCADGVDRKAGFRVIEGRNDVSD